MNEQPLGLFSLFCEPHNVQMRKHRSDIILPSIMKMLAFCLKHDRAAQPVWGIKIGPVSRISPPMRINGVESISLLFGNTCILYSSKHKKCHYA